MFGVDGGGLLEGVDELGFDARLDDEDVHASMIGRVGGSGTDRAASEFPAKGAGNPWQSCQSPAYPEDS
jgi:hypothetical protein